MMAGIDLHLHHGPPYLPEEERVEPAYEAGKEARKNGLPVSANQHPQYTPEGRSFLIGWHEEALAEKLGDAPRWVVRDMMNYPWEVALLNPWDVEGDRTPRAYKTEPEAIRAATYWNRTQSVRYVVRPRRTWGAARRDHLPHQPPS